MRKSPEQARFERQLCTRTKELREALGWSAEEMASMLRIPAERYRKYESRSPMPQYLLPLFAAITRAPLDHLLGKPVRTAEEIWAEIDRDIDGSLLARLPVAERELLQAKFPELLHANKAEPKEGKIDKLISLVLQLLKEIRTARPK